LLEAEFKKVIQKGEFYIHNAYRKLRDAYEFYRTETEIALDIVTKHHEKRSAEKPDIHRVVSSIRAMMTDPDHFEQYLQDRSRYEDAITNRDI
jgi:hypothetical protein